MSHVFLSYSHDDNFFAELASIKLEEAGISVWVDHGRLRAGEDWRSSIDKGISDSFALIVALSSSSCASAFVTYEWASAMGKGKPIVPVRLTDCSLHPKLDVIQYLDFSNKDHQPWSLLIERISEVHDEYELPEFDVTNQPLVDSESPDDDVAMVRAILSYLNQRGYQMVSFSRIRKRIDERLTDEQLTDLIARNKFTFRPVKLSGGKPGMAIL
ncbi:MAG: toll/interleukin-1 receptor domain-containing protein [Planctomycetota bacterium]